MKQLRVLFAAVLVLSARVAMSQSAPAPAATPPAGGTGETPPPAATPTAPATPAPSTPAPVVNTPPAGPAPAPAGASAAPTPASPATPAPKVTTDFGGWFVLQSFYDVGGLNASDLPRWATTAKTDTYGDENLFGMAVRQSRFRFNIGLPTDGLLAGAETKGFLEWDFGGQRGGDVSSWLPRLRHAYATATWKNLGNLQVLVGQTWGVVPGPYFPTSIMHLQVPRFGGAGLLFRRSPQVRVSGTVPAAAGVGLTYTGAVLEPDAGGASQGAYDTVGEKGGVPQVEGRISVNYKMNGKQLIDVGGWGHYGTERFDTYDPATAGSTTGVAAKYTGKTLHSQVVGVDVKIDVPFVSVIGQYFTGQNIDNYFSTAPGVRTTTAIDPMDTTCGGVDGKGFCLSPNQNNRKANTILTNAENVKTKGYFVQATLTPVKGLQLAAGYGMEDPDDDTLAALNGTTVKERILKNEQLSGGIIYNINTRWRLAFEATQYKTKYDQKKSATADTTVKTYESSQFELGTLVAF